MNDNQLLRYSRHILLPEIGIEGQQQINAAHVLVIGAGGLGSPALLYLASSGVGTITVCDDDKVDLSNLQRQVIHSTDSVGTPKVASAQKTLSTINPEIKIIALNERLSDHRLAHLVEKADVVVDCSDNFATRYAVNATCKELGKPLVSGAAIHFSGQVAVFDFRVPDSPCYNCLYPADSEVEEVRCSTMGVFAPLLGIIGSIQASETLKLLINTTNSLHSKLLVLDALNMNPRTLHFKRDPHCGVCATA